MEIKNRQDYNRKCLNYLVEYVEKYPEMRFIQALWNCGLINKDKPIISEGLYVSVPMIEDRFHEEPDITLKKLENLFSKERN